MEGGKPDRLSAMAAWEVCPALVEGIVDLPRIKEEEDDEVCDNGHGFRTNEGWWVRDPVSEAARASAKHRAKKWGIADRLGKGTTKALSTDLPSYMATARKEYVQRCKLAQVSSEGLPRAPLLHEEDDAEVTGAVAERGEVFEDEVKASEASAPRRRKRGRRRRGHGPESGTVSIWTFNTSGAPQLRAAVNHCRSSGRDVPVAILCQEHHAGADRIADLQAQIRKESWRLAAAHATPTVEGGWSAGVGICTPAHVAAGIDGALAVDQSPSGSPGRMAALWVQQVAPGGVLLLSCYLHDVEHGSVRNAELLEKALVTAKSSGCPWIIGLDAQEEPQDLLRWAAPMVDRASGAVVHPDAPTHVPGVGKCRCMDYFILDKSIAPAVVKLDLVSELRCHSSDADYTITAKPHKAVRLVLRQKCMPLLVDTLRMPRAFPRNKPVGCARRPVQPREHVAVMEQKRRGEYVSEKYGKLVEAVEL